MKNITNCFRFFKRFIVNLDKYIKYQLITKGILTIIIIPLYSLLSNYLISRDGENMFTNGDIIRFLVSPSGFAFSLFLFIVIMIEAILEIGGYVLICSRVRGGYTESSYIDILRYNIKLLPKMISIGGILIILYLGIMTPVTGFGIKLNFFKGLTMPKFALEVIDQNTLYSIVYLACFIILLYLGFKFIFTFNFMIIYKMKPLKAILSSSRLVTRNKLKIIKTLAVVYITTFLISAIVILMWLFMIEKLDLRLNFDRTSQRIFIIFLLQLQTLGIIVVSFLSSPFRCYCITELFYEIIDNRDKEVLNEEILGKKEYLEIKNKKLGIYPDIKEKYKKTPIDLIFSHKKLILVFGFVFLVLYSSIIGIFAKEVLGYNKNIEIYGHRGFGFSAPENSLSAFKHAIDHHLDYIEIDVQRTKDRYYVLNHDKTFQRVSYNQPKYINKKVYELTYNQIKKLDIGSKISPKYRGEKVPTIQQVLDLCKDKIKINLELKENVDKKMMDDIMKMIEYRNMKKDVILTSLSAKNLNYIEEKDPSFQTGLIYYIKIGNYKNYKVDYMIMEEGLADKKTVRKLRNMGKKVVIWTINSTDLLDKYAKLPIDGIITDYPVQIKNRLNQNKKIGMNGLIMSSFDSNLNDLFEKYK